VLMDVEMPGLDGLAATRALAADDGPSVLILTTFDRDEYLFAALQAGASGFLLKNGTPEALTEAVRVVARGDALLAPELTRRVIATFSRPGGSPSPAEAKRLAELTPREHEVLVELAAGSTNAEIAAALGLGETTVKTHVSRVLMKLGARDRTQAVVLAYELGVVRPGPSRGGPA
jgi:DNA-binding NarL/FixJ family response regulator